MQKKNIYHTHVTTGMGIKKKIKHYLINLIYSVGDENKIDKK